MGQQDNSSRLKQHCSLLVQADDKPPNCSMYSSLNRLCQEQLHIVSANLSLLSLQASHSRKKCCSISTFPKLQNLQNSLFPSLLWPLPTPGLKTKLVRVGSQLSNKNFSPPRNVGSYVRFLELGRILVLFRYGRIISRLNLN